MKIYVTKYALTTGIQEFDAEDCDKGMMVVRSGALSQYHHAGDWHLTRSAAVAKAEEMRKKKLQSLEKQMKKISKLVF